MDINEKLKQMGIVLPEKTVKGGVYQPVLKTGRQLYVSGQGCTKEGTPVYQGRVGAECSLEDAQVAAKLCAINALAALNQYLGDLNGIRLVKTLAFVSSDPSFSLQHLAANGCSEFLREVFGDEKGVGARSAIGVAQLPGNIPVEIEFLFEEIED